MESKLVFLLLLVCVSYTVGQDSSNSDSSDSNSSGSDGSSSSEEDNYPCSREDLNCINEERGNVSSSDDDFYYPCQPQDNVNCIRNYFASIWQCKRVSHKDGVGIPSRSLLKSYVPTVNLTASSESDIYTFYGSKVTAFYVNRKTNNLVLSVDFDGINKNSSLTTFVVNQRGREPAVVSDYLNETYSAELTGVIPFRGRFGLKGSVVTVYNKNGIIPFDVGPNLITSSDPAISAMFAGLVGDIPSALQQLLLTKGPFFFYTYVQNYICDFGFKYTGWLV